MEYRNKKVNLQEMMQKWTKQDCAVAFSGGVDSSLLLLLAVKAAKENGTRVYAVTADTELHALADKEIAHRVAIEAGAQHILVQINELDEAEIRHNPPDRCYRCKSYLFRTMQQEMQKLGVSVILEGTNADDMKVYRPGIRALAELGIISPLREAGFTKAQVRRMAEEYGISVADRPSAPCLATRFPYGDTLTLERMRQVEQGEMYFRSLGFYNVRLRLHGDIARIEVDEAAMPKLLAQKDEIVQQLQRLGFVYITMDLEGFRSGSMDIHVNGTIQ